MVQIGVAELWGTACNIDHTAQLNFRGCINVEAPRAMLAWVCAMSAAITKGDCPCGTGRTYLACCGHWHAQSEMGESGEQAPTPQELMRSRYSAYVLGKIHYLLATWHPSTSPGELELQPIQWLGLEVRHAEMAGDAGVVEFVARYKVNGRAERMAETSRFVRQDGRWWYIDGQVSD
jgi:SEC-C motif-containing protein